jgi:hypothetical protein
LSYTCTRYSAWKYIKATKGAITEIEEKVIKFQRNDAKTTVKGHKILWYVKSFDKLMHR